MEVQVGQALRLREETWLVSRISETRWTEYAGCTSKEWQELYLDVGTQNEVLDRHFDQFEKDDIINFEECRITLEQPGKNTMAIITKIHARKVGQKEEQDGVLRDSTDVPVEGVRDEEPVADVRSGLDEEVGGSSGVGVLPVL